MDRPDVAAIRDWAPPDFDWDGVGYPDDEDGNRKLGKRLDWAIGYVENTTGRPISTIAPPATPSPDHPDLTPIAEQAILLALAQQVLQGGRRYLKANVLQDYIASFTAGSYSETRRRPDERAGASNPPVNAWRALSDLLYLLMTDEMLAYWRQRLSGITPPAAAFVSQDFRSTWDGGDSDLPTVYGSGVSDMP